MIAQKIEGCARTLFDATHCDRVDVDFLDNAFHVLAGCHEVAREAGMDEAVLWSLQGAADLAVAMQQSRFVSQPALAVVACWLEGLAEELKNIESTTPVPVRPAGAVILPFRSSAAVPFRGPGAGGAA